MKPEIAQTQSWRYKPLVVIKCQKQTTITNKLFDTRSAALYYCNQAVSGTVCLVFCYLLLIKCSAFCTRCSELWNSVREKHNRVLLATRILAFFFCTERGRGNVNHSPTYPGSRLSNWCNYNLSSNGRKCRLKNSGSESKRKSNRRTWRLCFKFLRSPLRLARFCNRFGDGYSNFCALRFYIRAVEGLLVAVSHLYESSCCSRGPKGSGFSH